MCTHICGKNECVKKKEKIERGIMPVCVCICESELSLSLSLMNHYDFNTHTHTRI